MQLEAVPLAAIARLASVQLASNTHYVSQRQLLWLLYILCWRQSVTLPAAFDLSRWPSLSLDDSEQCVKAVGVVHK